MKFASSTLKTTRLSWAFPILFAFAATVLATASEPAPDARLVATGQRKFRWQCSFCHALDENHTGPRLRDVIGRAAGSVAEFRYSPALANAGFVWDDATLNRWLSGPSRFIPGVRMEAQVPEPEDRLAIIAFLRHAATVKH